MSPRERIARLYESYLKRTPRQSRSRAAVDALIESALDMLGRLGDEDALRVEDVATRAGVGIGSLYDWCGDREKLLASLQAKTTELNLAKFEAVLAKIPALSLRDAIQLIVDFAFAEYLRDVRSSRALLRIATRNGLMPFVTKSVDVFSGRLAASLATRDDVRACDLEIAASILSESLLGVVQASVWRDFPQHDETKVREALVEMMHAYLRKP